jgi:hypothetical protein
MRNPVSSASWEMSLSAQPGSVVNSRSVVSCLVRSMTSEIVSHSTKGVNGSFSRLLCMRHARTGANLPIKITTYGVLVSVLPANNYPLSS